MGLFGKKKLTFEEILEGLAGLAPEEKEAIKAKLDEPPEPEAPESAEKATEETANSPEDAPEEIADAKDNTAEAENTEVGTSTEEPVPEAEPKAPQMDGEEKNNEADILAGLVERLQTVEKTLADFKELKEKMEEYVAKQKESFGYKSESAGTHKDYSDMSAAELKAHILGN